MNKHITNKEQKLTASRLYEHSDTHKKSFIDHLTEIASLQINKTNNLTPKLSKPGYKQV